MYFFLHREIIQATLNVNSDYLVLVLTVKYLLSPFLTENVRLFTICGDIYTNNRSTLLPENQEMLLFLKNNLHMLNYEFYEKLIQNDG